MPRSKKPAVDRAPTTTGKTPRVAKPPDLSGRYPLWSFAIVDVGGPWCFRCLPSRELPSVLARLGQFEGMTWTQIEQGTGSHFVSCGRLVRNATKRLQELRYDDIDQLFSLRIKGKPRIWGIRAGSVLRILWWDPEHEVCRSGKR